MPTVPASASAASSHQPHAVSATFGATMDPKTTVFALAEAPEDQTTPAAAGLSSRPPVASGPGRIPAPQAQMVVDHGPVSCVTRDTALEHCSRHRFIAWAAVKRNSNLRIRPEDRLACPLLRCRRQFPDHEAMLKHLDGCKHLTSGEYWCYDHMRAECFGDSKCMCCLTHPSKRKKIVSMAGKFFRSLGHRKPASPTVPASIVLGHEDDPSLAPPPPSYDSLWLPPPCDARELSSIETEILEIDSVEVRRDHTAPPPPSPLSPPSPLHSHPSSAAAQLRVLAAESDVGIDPQALLTAELDSTALEYGQHHQQHQHHQHQHQHQHQQPPAQWQPDSPPDATAGRSVAAKPALQVTTTGLQSRRYVPRQLLRPEATAAAPRGKGLAPSSSVRSTASTDSSSSNVSNVSYVSATSNISSTSHGSSLISPASDWSGVWSIGSGFNTSQPSPTDLTGDAAAFTTNNDFTEAMDTSFNQFYPGNLHEVYCELPADSQHLAAAHTPVTTSNTTTTTTTTTTTAAAEAAAALRSTSSPIPPDGLMMPVTSAPLLFGFPVSAPAAMADVPAYSPSLLLGVGSPFSSFPGLNEPLVGESNICYSEAKSLIESAWDTLQEHIVTSMIKMNDLRGNPLVDQLRHLSSRSIATAGLRTLRLRLVDGRRSTSALDTLCFLHLVFAFSLVMYGQEPAPWVKDLFMQSLSYTSSLPPADQDSYRQLAFRFWQPVGTTETEISGDFAIAQSDLLGQGFMYKGKGPEMPLAGHPSPGRHDSDSLLVAAQNFLDELESSLVLGEAPSHDVQSSDLYMKHVSDITLPEEDFFAHDIHCTVKSLVAHPEWANLGANLSRVLGQVRHGNIHSFRRAEIEILGAGKRCLPAYNFFNDYMPAVRSEIDPMYSLSTTPRTAYHELGISLIEKVMLELDNSNLNGLPTVLEPLPVTQDNDDELDFIRFSGDYSTVTPVSATTMARPYFFPMTGGHSTHAPFDFSFGSPIMVKQPLSEPTRSPVMMIPTPPETSPVATSPVTTMKPPKRSRTEPARTQRRASAAAIPHSATTSLMGGSMMTRSPVAIKTAMIASSSSMMAAAATSPSHNSLQQQQQQQQPGDSPPKVEADSCCELCGYRPKGDPQWFKGSMAKHKKLQHSEAPPRIYRCPHPGCTSQYRNRPDNLRQHQIEKNHWAPGQQAPPQRSGSNKRKRATASTAGHDGSRDGSGDGSDEELAAME